MLSFQEHTQSLMRMLRLLFLKHFFSDDINTLKKGIMPRGYIWRKMIVTIIIWF